MSDFEVALADVWPLLTAEDRAWVEDQYDKAGLDRSDLMLPTRPSSGMRSRW